MMRSAICRLRETGADYHLDAFVGISGLNSTLPHRGCWKLSLPHRASHQHRKVRRLRWLLGPSIEHIIDLSFALCSLGADNSDLRRLTSSSASRASGSIWWVSRRFVRTFFGRQRHNVLGGTRLGHQGDCRRHQRHLRERRDLRGAAPEWFECLRGEGGHHGARQRRRTRSASW